MTACRAEAGASVRELVAWGRRTGLSQPVARASCVACASAAVASGRREMEAQALTEPVSKRRDKARMEANQDGSSPRARWTQP